MQTERYGEFLTVIFCFPLLSSFLLQAGAGPPGTTATLTVPQRWQKTVNSGGCQSCAELAEVTQHIHRYE